MTSDTPATAAQKLEVLQDFLANGATARIYVTVLPRVGNNAPLLPERLYAQDIVSLDIGYATPVPIPDLKVFDLGVTGTLSFGGRPFYVEIPMDCIFMVDSGSRRAVFPGYEPLTLERPSTVTGDRPTVPAPVAPAEGAKVLSLDAASRRLRGRPLRRGTGSGVFPRPPTAG